MRKSGRHTIQVTDAATDETLPYNLEVQCLAGACPAQPAPTRTILSPLPGQIITVPNVTVTWTPDARAFGYTVEVKRKGNGDLAFSGRQAGYVPSTTVVNLPAGTYTVGVKACSDSAFMTCIDYDNSHKFEFPVQLPAPTTAPQIVNPPNGATLNTSTQLFRWTAVPDATYYQVKLTKKSPDTTELFVTVPATELTTAFSMRSGLYKLAVQACTIACGPEGTSDFEVKLGGVPTEAPTFSGCTVTNDSSQNSLICVWNPVAGADLFVIQVIQPAGGPGGGALTVASAQVDTTSATLLVPNGAAGVVVQACNGDGCGPVRVGPNINPNFGNPKVPILGTPVKGRSVDGPAIQFSWSRVPGDNGSNTTYRLYVQDLARQQPALDIVTTQNFWAAQFAPGRRYDAQVIANPSGTPLTGPAQGFTTRGAGPFAPTLVSPQHQSSVTQGNLKLAWTPVDGAALYEYFVARPGQLTATVTGVASGLEVQVPLFTVSNANTVYNGIVRACTSPAVCGPWSNTAGGPGVTSFTVTQ